MTRTESALQELQRTNQKLEHLAATDPLTGAANRRHFIERVEAEVARARRDGVPFSLLALDLDNFKWVNDAYGHQVGDTVLQGFVQACLDAIRPYNGVARVGGEEFMVLLSRTSLMLPLRSANVSARRLPAPHSRVKPDARFPSRSVSASPSSAMMATRSMPFFVPPTSGSTTRSVMAATV